MSYPAPTYYWLRFACDLKPGYYRITVKAVDLAGNAQTTIGHNWLKVVRHGAPRQTHPWWPAGLPDTSGRIRMGSMGAARAPSNPRSCSLSGLWCRWHPR
jgi:hypothetical protein